jgi:flagellar motor component MotA
MAIASLVFGILSILFIFTGPFSFVGIILGGVGIVLGALARKQEPSDVATGGLVTSIVGCAMAMVFNLACVACIFGGAKVMEEAAKNPQMPQISKSLEDLTRSLKELEKKANEEAQKNKK